MASRHKLSPQDRWFLSKGLCDPVTKRPFAVGDSVVICANCKVPHDASTWGLDETKCCASCQGNTLLEFEEFSPKILRPKVIHTTGFRVVGEKLSLKEKLDQFNGYPWAYAMIILLPLLTAAVLFYSLYAQGTQPLSLVQTMGTVAQARLEQMSRTVDWKLSEVMKRVEEEKILDWGEQLAAGTRHAGAKICMLPDKFLLILSGLRDAFPHKVQPVLWKIQEAADSLEIKLESIFNRTLYKVKQKFS